MKLTLRGWNQPYQELQNEQDSLAYLDGRNKTRYSRRKNKEGLLELASREAHEKQMTYYATILNDDDTPYCAMAANEGYFGIEFLRDDFDEYLLYDYRDSYATDGRLFLNTIILCECYPGTKEKKRRVDYRFLPDGSFRTMIYQGIFVEGTYEEIGAEHPALSQEELSLLWLDYPEFGQYDELIRLDRIPKLALEQILEYTDSEFPAFREHLARDIAKYQGSSK